MSTKVDDLLLLNRRLAGRFVEEDKNYLAQDFTKSYQDLTIQVEKLLSKNVDVEYQMKIIQKENSKLAEK